MLSRSTESQRSLLAIVLVSVSCRVDNRSLLFHFHESSNSVTSAFKMFVLDSSFSWNTKRQIGPVAPLAVSGQLLGRYGLGGPH